ncbi:MAG: hypothetical protein AAGD07_16065, partial [Planctomycetota bacterium]
MQRSLQPQALEPRQLLAGPELIGIQPNVDELIRNSSSVGGVPQFSDSSQLFVSPRELTFRFDSDTVIDPDTLGDAADPLGISITRAGEDRGFEVATAATDLGTTLASGVDRALLELRASSVGVTGNGTLVRFTATDRGIGGVPVLVAADPDAKTVDVSLNSNQLRPATMRDVVLTINGDAAANALVTAVQVTGPTQSPVGSTLSAGETSVVLLGANSAQAVTDLGTNNSIGIRIVANQSGASGLGTRVDVVRRDFGGPSAPLVSVSGKVIQIEVNTAANFETTADEFVAAINGTPTAADLVTASLETGDGGTAIGATFAGSITLTGATDTPVFPGFIGVGNQPNEVVFRFAEPLPDDLYQVQVFGTGDRALANVDGERFNNGEDFAVQFGLNVAPQVLAVVPEPVERRLDGSFNPNLNVIE